MEEKSKGLEKSMMGVVGIETSFPVMYTYFVRTGIITIDKLIDLMYVNPKKRFGINSSFENGCFTLYDLSKKYTVNPETFKSMGRATPFDGIDVYGRCTMTFYKGELVWQENLM